jgi:hypothetical protein
VVINSQAYIKCFHINRDKYTTATSLISHSQGTSKYYYINHDLHMRIPNAVIHSQENIECFRINLDIYAENMISRLQMITQVLTLIAYCNGFAAPYGTFTLTSGINITSCSALICLRYMGMYNDTIWIRSEK